MAKKLKFNDWLLIDSDEKCAWLAKRYGWGTSEGLLKYCAYLKADKKIQEAVPQDQNEWINWANSYDATPQGMLEFNKLKSAWRSYKHSKRRGGKQLSITTKAVVIKKFDRLASQQKMGRSEFFEYMLDLNAQIFSKADQALLQSSINNRAQMHAVLAREKELLARVGALEDALDRSENTALSKAIFLAVEKGGEYEQQLLEAINDAGGFNIFQDKICSMHAANSGSATEDELAAKDALKRVKQSSNGDKAVLAKLVVNMLQELGVSSDDVLEALPD